MERLHGEAQLLYICWGVPLPPLPGSAWREAPTECGNRAGELFGLGADSGAEAALLARRR